MSSALDNQTKKISLTFLPRASAILIKVSVVVTASVPHSKPDIVARDMPDRLANSCCVRCWDSRIAFTLFSNLSPP